MSSMSIKIGMIYDQMGSYESIAAALGDKISATRIRRMHLGEGAGWDDAIDRLCIEIESEYVPTLLLKLRSQFSYLIETGDRMALARHAELTRALLDAGVDWDAGCDDEIDDRRTGPFIDFLRGYAHFALEEHDAAILSFLRASEGLRRLAPGKVDITCWETVHISLAQQMALMSAYQLVEAGACSSKVISQVANNILAAGATNYLERVLKVAPVWQLSFNYASVLASADVSVKQKLGALARAIFMNPQLADFDVRLKGMGESINECRYLAPVARLLEAEQPRLLQAAREIVGRAQGASSRPAEAGKEIGARKLPSVRRQIARALGGERIFQEG